MTFHEKLKRLCEDRSQCAVSRRAGLSETAVARVLARKQLPRSDRALSLARALSVSVEWLLDDAQGWPPVWANAPKEQTAGAA